MMNFTRLIDSLDIGNIKLIDFLIAPAFEFNVHDRCAIWNWVRSFQTCNEQTVPLSSVLPKDPADNFWLSVIICNETNQRVVQVHDGNHRIVALAMYKPDLTLRDIVDHIKFIHHSALTIEDTQYLSSVDHNTTNLELAYWFEDYCAVKYDNDVGSITHKKTEDPGHNFASKSVIEIRSWVPVSFSNKNLFITRSQTVGWHVLNVLEKLFLLYSSEDDINTTAKTLVNKNTDGSRQKCQTIDILRDLFTRNCDSNVSRRLVLKISKEELPSYHDYNTNFRKDLLGASNEEEDSLAVAGSFTRWSYGANHGPFYLPPGQYSFKYYNRNSDYWAPSGKNFNMCIHDERNKDGTVVVKAIFLT